MTYPFDVWAQFFRAPFSGDVIQEIVPRLFSPDIKGVPEIEAKVLTEVASYGKQLGKILDALQILSAKTNTPLPEIEALIAKVDKIKKESRDDIRDHAREALERLRAADEDAWRELVRAPD